LVVWLQLNHFLMTSSQMYWSNLLELCW
jgi:hypothetical protein